MEQNWIVGVGDDLEVDVLAEVIPIPGTSEVEVELLEVTDPETGDEVDLTDDQEEEVIEYIVSRQGDYDV